MLSNVNNSIALFVLVSIATTIYCSEKKPNNQNYTALQKLVALEQGSLSPRNTSAQNSPKSRTSIELVIQEPVHTPESPRSLSESTHTSSPQSAAIELSRTQPSPHPHQLDEIETEEQFLCGDNCCGPNRCCCCCDNDPCERYSKRAILCGIVTIPFSLAGGLLYMIVTAPK